MDIDDRDGFGPIRTVAAQQAPETNNHTGESKAAGCIVQVCIALLTKLPVLQSASGEPTRDKTLTELVIDCAEVRPEKFLLICPIFLDSIKRRTLNLSTHSLASLVGKFEPFLIQYEFAKSERLQLLVTRLLVSTVHIWLPGSVAMSDVGSDIRQLWDWLANSLKSGKIRGWRVRDAFARFLDRYLSLDPGQGAWSLGDEDEDAKRIAERSPSALLPMLGSDRDMRVRFRAAVLNARLLPLCRQVGCSDIDMYMTIKQWYTDELHQ